MEFNIRKAFLFGLAIVLFFLLFGPYTYKIYNSTALIYLICCFSFFLLGMNFSKRKNNRKVPCEYSISKFGFFFLFILQSLAIFCSVYFVLFVFRSTDNFSFAGGDFRSIITENRTIFQRFAEAIMHFSAPIYLIIHYSVNKLNAMQNLVLLIGYWLTPLSYLSIGARWSLFFYLILFLYIHLISGRRKNLKSSFHLINNNKIGFKKFLLLIIFIVFLIITLNIVYSLFVIRGMYSADKMFMYENGDMVLKGWAKTLYESSVFFFNPLYKISHYFSHSIPAFTYFFNNFDINTSMLFGLYSFSVLQYLLIPFGFSTNYMKKLLYSLEGSGLYLTFTHGYIIDFGLVLAPIFIFLTGFLFRYIELRINHNILCKWLYPYIIGMSFIAPLYNMWTVAMVNIDIFFIFILYFSLNKLSWKRKKIINILNKQEVD